MPGRTEKTPRSRRAAMTSAWFGRQGRGPTWLMSPRITLSNWGNSSSFVRRRSRPIGVTHVDGSGRLQTVTKSANARYWKLISAFGELTGVPIVLNTSFNENEPVVCKPEEAIDCFLRTKMDVLVLGDTYIAR